jgi:hypothetical protein
MAEKRKKGRRDRGLPPIGRKVRRQSLAWILIIGLSALVLVSWMLHLHSADPSNALAATGGTPPGFRPTVTNTPHAPDKAPDGMVWIPGGEFSMGANDPPDMDDVGMKATLDAQPIHRVYVDGFFMDQTDVTNAQFAEFVKATGYVTIAERSPTAEEFPGAPPENLFAGSVVFSPPDHAVSLDNHFQWWSYVRGANWRHHCSFSKRYTTRKRPSGALASARGLERSSVVRRVVKDSQAVEAGSRSLGKRKANQPNPSPPRGRVLDITDLVIHGQRILLRRYANNLNFRIAWPSKRMALK